MDEKTRKNFELTMNDLLDRASACESDSPDYNDYISQAIAIEKLLNEEKRMNDEKEIENKKIEAQTQISKRDLFNVGTPIVAGAIGLLARFGFLEDMWSRISNFEQNNSFTSSAGRWFSREIGGLFNFRKR